MAKAKERRAKGWTSIQGEYVMCPVPDCGHMGAMITKAHCRIAHNLERSEVEKQFGGAYRVLKRQGGR